MTRIRIKFSTLLTFAVATILGAALFWVSQQVQQLEREQREMSSQIASEKEGMRVLTAEWDYLNRPDRIEALAARYLDKMAPVTPHDLLVNANAVPEPQVMQGEDETPVLVSTGDAGHTQGKKDASVSAAPEAKPIRDAEDSKTTDFDGVLKATGEDDQ